MEPTAQYNHEGPGRSKPPICPWRIEVGHPGKGARTMFLHVLELVDEDVVAATDVKPVGAAGVDIGDRWKVRFQADGAPGGSVGGAPLSTSIKIDTEYH